MQFECEVGFIANASRNGCTLEDTPRKILIRTRGKLRHFDTELEQLQLDKVVVDQVLVDYSHAGLIVT